MSRDRRPTSPKACDRAAGIRHRGPYCWAEALPEDLSKGVTLAEWSVRRVTRQPVSRWNPAWEDNWGAVLEGGTGYERGSGRERKEEEQETVRVIRVQRPRPGHAHRGSARQTQIAEGLGTDQKCTWRGRCPSLGDSADSPSPRALLGPSLSSPGANRSPEAFHPSQRVTA